MKRAFGTFDKILSSRQCQECINTHMMQYQVHLVTGRWAPLSPITQAILDSRSYPNFCVHKHLYALKLGQWSTSPSECKHMLSPSQDCRLCLKQPAYNYMSIIFCKQNSNEHFCSIVHDKNVLSTHASYTLHIAHTSMHRADRDIIFSTDLITLRRCLLCSLHGARGAADGAAGRVDGVDRNRAHVAGF